MPRAARKPPRCSNRRCFAKRGSRKVVTIARVLKRCIMGIQMAKRVSERATRGGDHGRVGTPHARGAFEIALGVGVDEASSISFRLRARRLVGSVTRRRGGPAAGSPAQWQRPRMQGCVRTRNRIAKSRWRWIRIGHAKRTPIFATWEMR